MTEEKIDVQQAVYFKPSEFKLVEEAAKVEDRTVSNFIRRIVLAKIEGED